MSKMRRAFLGRNSTQKFCSINCATIEVVKCSYCFKLFRNYPYKLKFDKSDIGFSINIEHGAARRFLYENNLKWHVDKILVFPTISEKEAYILEKELINKFNLMGS